MRDTQPYEESKIEISSIEFRKIGFFHFEGTVDGIEFSDSWNDSKRDFEKILPKIEGKYMDDDDLCNAVLDQHANLHWFLLIDGIVFHKVVRLKPIIETALYELYIKSL